jgi:hypothetical protein
MPGRIDFTVVRCFVFRKLGRERLTVAGNQFGNLEAPGAL